MTNYKKLKNCGISLMETMIAVSIFTITIFAITSLLVSFYRYNAYGIEQATAISAATRGIEPTINHIRETTYSDEGAYPIISAATSSLSFYSDINADNNIEKIRLFLEDDIFKKGVIKSSGNPLSYVGQPETIFILSENVRNESLGSDLFSYVDKTGSSIIGLPNISDIAFVVMNVIVNVNPSRSPTDFTLRASAALRNIKFIKTTPPSNANLLVGLIAHYTFDENTGTVANDTSVNNNPGEVINASWTTGKIGSALDFDGSGDYVNVPNNSFIQMDWDSPCNTYTRTHSAWIYPRSLSGVILSKDTNGAGKGYIEITPAGAYQLKMSMSASNVTTLSSAGQADLNTWQHLTYTFDSTNCSAMVTNIYKNGVLIITDTTNGGSTQGNKNKPMTFGARNGTGNWFNGKIDDVRIYNRILTPTEILQLFNAG